MDGIGERSAQPRGYRFGAFELDVRSGELRRRGLKVRVRGRPIEILTVLIERKDEVVTRDELRGRLWKSDTFVDFDHGLNSAMNKLREALGDTADNPRFVETVPRRGYRFIAPVESLSESHAAAAQPTVSEVATSRVTPSFESVPPSGLDRVEPASRTADIDLPHASRWTSPRRLGLVAVAVLAVLAAGAFWANRRATAPAALRRVMIVVLPFENLSGIPDDEFFSDGITDEMIAQLGWLDPNRLGVIARTTAMQYKRSTKGVMQIGQELNVEYLLEGSIRRDAERVRITTQLVDVQSQTQLWTETYERELKDVLMLQRDVAMRISESLAGGVFSPILARAPIPSPTFAAYELVLRGRALRQQATEESTRQCISTFEEAIAIDANYAPAHAALADCYRLLGAPGWEVAPPQELIPRAEEAVARALALDAELAEGHAVRGMIRFSYNWDLEGALRDLDRAIMLNPSYARAHQYRSAVLTTTGRFEDAVRSARKAFELDPLSPTESTTLGVRLYYARQYTEAIAQFERTIVTNPGFYVAHWGLGECYLQLGRLDEAIAQLRLAVERSDDSAYIRAWLAHGLATAGRRPEAEAIRADIVRLARERFVSPFLFALMASGFGEREATLDWLEKTYAVRSGWMPFVAVEPELRWLQNEPRLERLIEQVRQPRS